MRKFSPGFGRRLPGLAVLTIAVLLALSGCTDEITAEATPEAIPATVPATKATTASPGWQPPRTWVFVVGILKYRDKDSFDSFPAKDRRDAELVEHFRKQGVPSDQIVYLQDRSATTVKIEKSLQEMLSRTRAGDLLFVYYTGHGYKDEDDDQAYFASYDASDDVKGWRMASLPIDIEKRFKGSRALLFADCCYAGVLVNEVKKRARRVGYAVLASSQASEESTANWTYTEALLDGLRGAPGSDLNNDRRVTLDEVSRYAADDMIFGEEQKSAWITTAGFDPKTVLSAAARKSDPKVGQRVEVLDEGEYWKARITDVDTNRYRVHWLGLQGYPDEWVTTRRTRFPKPASATAPAFEPGALVEVKWQGDWYPAKVLKVDGRTFYIHYIEDTADWDEWVSSKRIRKRQR